MGEDGVQILKRCVGIPPTPDSGPNPHFLEKWVSGSKNPHFLPLALTKAVFGPKLPIFYVFPLEKKGAFLTENSLFPSFWFLDSETLFSRKWGFGPLSGAGGIPSQTCDLESLEIHTPPLL